MTSHVQGLISFLLPSAPQGQSHDPQNLIINISVLPSRPFHTFHRNSDKKLALITKTLPMFNLWQTSRYQDRNHITKYYEHDSYSTKEDLKGKISAISQQPTVLKSTIAQTFSVLIIRVIGQLNMMQTVTKEDFSASICLNAKNVTPC
jgi:hypothetical protein